MASPAEIVSAMYGEIESWCTLSTTGPIENRVRNIANVIRTLLGGVCGIPSA